MEIIWLGHSCFRIKGKEAIVITDPCSPGTGYDIGRQEADIVTISHDHGGHNFASQIEPVSKASLRGLSPEDVCYARPKLVKGPGEYDVANVLITGISSFHDNEEGGKNGKNCIYLIVLDDITICHLGDIGHKLSTDQLNELSRVQVLFLPVGGVSTIDAATAAEIVRTLEPKVVIPMHYKTRALTFDLDSLEAFLSQMALKEIIPQTKLSVTKSNLPEQTRVVVMEYPAPG